MEELQKLIESKEKEFIGKVQLTLMADCANRIKMARLYELWVSYSVTIGTLIKNA